MDKILLNNMKFYGFHGLLPEEKKIGQRFNVDVELFLSLQKAGQTDDMNDSIHYGYVYEQIKKVVEGDPVNLIETVAEKIATQLFVSFPLLSACTIKVFKPDPPIQGHYESVAVEIYREKKL